MAREKAALFQQLEGLLPLLKVESVEELSFEDRIALVQTHALVSIAQSLESLDRLGIDVHE